MTFLPYKDSHLALLGLLLVDLPVILAVAVIGHKHGYMNTYEDVSAWRLEHPWSLTPTVALAAWLVVRWRHA